MTIAAKLVQDDLIIMVENDGKSLLFSLTQLIP
jgi:hypothetical protein